MACCAAVALAQPAPTKPAVVPAPVAQPFTPTPPPAQTDPNAIRVLLTPELETALVAQMVGRIVTLNASLGSRVVKGTTVVAFDCSESLARLEMAQAEQAGARETLDVKTRLLKLEAAGESEVILAAAAASRTTAAIALARAQLGQCNVKSPFTGRVVRVLVKPHQGVNVGTPLVELVSDGPLKLRLNAPSRLLRTLSVGTPFEVTIDETGKNYPAKVTAINARVDAVAQTVELEGRISSKATDLLAGMTGTARFKSAP
ncbi:MAG: efflux RND transporter periplasmic adaptor subunit [Rhodoferax sp.]|nr:efflux RND transporter periplasmic adaptor subunit [Rhodoferax sp.]